MARNSLASVLTHGLLILAKTQEAKTASTALAHALGMMSDQQRKDLYYDLKQEGVI